MKTGRFISVYLKADSVKKAGEQVVTITSIEAETLGRGDEAQNKLVAYFEELDQGLVLNKSNLSTLEEIFKSDETDDYIGKKITLWFDPSVRFSGKRVGGIRVKAAEKTKA
jgi:hypothetical protein